MSIGLESEEVVYTCHGCGGHKFYVEEFYEVTWNYTYVLDCGCDSAEGPAATRQMHRTDAMKRVGTIGADHRVSGWAEPEEVEAGAPEEDETEAFCALCVAEAEEQDWRFEDDGSETDGEEFFVRCEKCDREIEFGWSHPDRGGRIWPTESSDFNPWKSWPGPRYREAWRAKGWLRPDLAA